MMEQHRRGTRLVAGALGAVVLVVALTVPGVTTAGAAASTVEAWVTPQGLGFGPVAVGTTSPAQAITVKNTGDVSTTVSLGATPAPFTSTTTCGPSLAVGANCTVSYRFAPTAVTPATGTATVTAGGVSHAISLAGQGSTTTPVSASR